MKYLLLLSTCSLSFASILTVDFDVFENDAPSRHANLSVTDGTNSVLFLDLYRQGGPPFVGQVTQLGYCSNLTGCTTPGGDLTTTVHLGLASNRLVLGGVTIPASAWDDYSVWFSMNFTGGGPMIGDPFGWSWENMDADLNIAVTQLSTGICVFCEHAPYGTGTANGRILGFPDYPYYRFSYHAEGDVPEPASWQLALIAAVALIASGVVRRRREFAGAAGRPTAKSFVICGQ